MVEMCTRLLLKLKFAEVACYVHVFIHLVFDFRYLIELSLTNTMSRWRVRLPTTFFVAYVAMNLTCCYILRFIKRLLLQKVRTSMFPNLFWR
jgi:hypothetical protein